MYNYSSMPSYVQQFLESNPNYLFQYWTSNALVSEYYKRALDYSQGKIYSNYLASLADNPEMMFGDYLGNINPMQYAQDLTQQQRGVDPRQYSRKSRWIIF